MVSTIFSLSASVAPDIAILATAAFVFGLTGGLIAYVAHKSWFGRWKHHSADEDKLMDVVHTSLLGFSAFVLALAITGVSANLSVAERDARQEALDIYQLRRELDAFGGLGAKAVQSLDAYVQHVATDEWPRLSKAVPSLSPLAQGDLDMLWRDIRAIQNDPALGSRQALDALSSYFSSIEHARSGRLAAATNSIPNVVWLMILLFVGGSSFMSGRSAPAKFSIRMVVIHMSAIGLVVALVMILDNPFRGETSVGPDIISAAVLHNASAPGR